MKHYFEKKEHYQKELEQYYQEKTNLRLKYAAYVSIAISIGLMIVTAFCIADMSKTAILLMRGFAGLSAFIFVILVAILVYRVNASYLKGKANSKRDRK